MIVKLCRESLISRAFDVLVFVFTTTTTSSRCRQRRLNLSMAYRGERRENDVFGDDVKKSDGVQKTCARRQNDGHVSDCLELLSHLSSLLLLLLLRHPRAAKSV